MDHALEALAAERGEVLKICSHLDAVLGRSRPVGASNTAGLGTEEAREVDVESRRGMSGPQVLDADGDVRTLAVLQRLRVF